ncbi:MAG: PEP-CTERM sorting domain-containing protein [Armatimonadota bacterium]|jgi:hypothetical protein
MKKFVVAVAIVVILLSAQISQAADLQEGWYVKLGWVDVRGWDGMRERVVDWDFTGPLGSVGPFEVTSPDPLWARRMISVPNTVSGIAPGTSVDLWGEPLSLVDFPITEVVVCYDTNYDAAKMRLQLFMYQQDTGFTLLWSEERSGLHQVWSNVLGQFQMIPVGYSPVFRVTVIPEPSTVLALFSGALCTFVACWRWKK